MNNDDEKIDASISEKGRENLRRHAEELEIEKQALKDSERCWGFHVEVLNGLRRMTRPAAVWVGYVVKRTARNVIVAVPRDCHVPYGCGWGHSTSKHARDQFRQHEVFTVSPAQQNVCWSLGELNVKLTLGLLEANREAQCYIQKLQSFEVEFQNSLKEAIEAQTAATEAAAKPA